MKNLLIIWALVVLASIPAKCVADSETDRAMGYQHGYYKMDCTGVNPHSRDVILNELMPYYVSQLNESEAYAKGFKQGLTDRLHECTRANNG